MHILFDIGGTKMKIGVSSDGKVIENFVIVPTPKDFEEGMQIFRNQISKLAKNKNIIASACGVTGPMDKEKTTLLNPPNLHGWKDKPLKKRLESMINAPVTLANDAALAGLGETVFGAAKGYKIVAFITVSTGLGGVRIVNQKIDDNVAIGFEPGHQVINFESNLLCGCGGKGHLEAYVSGSGIAKRFGKRAEDIKDKDTWEEIAKLLAFGLNNIIVHWSPEVIVFGGSVMRSMPLDRVSHHLKNIVTIFSTIPQLKYAQHNEVAGLYGALALLYKA